MMLSKRTGFGNRRLISLALPLLIFFFLGGFLANRLIENKMTAVIEAQLGHSVQTFADLVQTAAKKGSADLSSPNLADIETIARQFGWLKLQMDGRGFLMTPTGRTIFLPSQKNIDEIADKDFSPDIARTLFHIKNGMLRCPLDQAGIAKPGKAVVVFRHLAKERWMVGAVFEADGVYSPVYTFRPQFISGLAAAALLMVLVAAFILKGFDKTAPAHAPVKETAKTDGQKALPEKDQTFKPESFQPAAFQFTGFLSKEGILEQISDNLAAITGWKGRALTGRAFWQSLWFLQDPDARLQAESAVRKAMSEKASTLESTIETADGKTRFIEMAFTRVPAASGSPEGIRIEGRDISHLRYTEIEKKRLEGQLLKAQKMEAMGTLAGGIAHDFNNILSSVLGYTQLAELCLDEPEKAKKHIGQIYKGSQRAASLVQQILAFSRQSDTRQSPLKLYLILKETLKLLRSTFPATIDITSHIDSKAMVMADPTQIHQVIMNLCTNAYHAMMETGGSLTINLSDVDPNGRQAEPVNLENACSYVKISVQDTGHGMDEETLQKAFDPFFTTKKPGEGTGFGLAQVLSVVTECKGTLHVESVPGKGTQFFIYLPAIEETPADPLPAPKARQLPSGHEAILLVDDDDAILSMTKELLETQGYTVNACENADMALAAFNRRLARFDLVLTDMTMPRMTGAELARHLLAKNPETRIILCTGYNEIITEDKALEMGIKRFLQKPLSNQELLVAIREVLDQDKGA